MHRTGPRALARILYSAITVLRYQDGLAKKELDDAADRFERRSGSTTLNTQP